MPDDRSATADPAPGHEPAHDSVPELLVGLVLSPQIAGALPRGCCPRSQRATDVLS